MVGTVVGALATALILGLFGWKVAADVRRRQREGTDPEDLNWRARYFRNYPRD